MTYTNDLVGKYLNRYGYTDINPIGKIIALKGKQSAIVQRVVAGENKTKMEFVVGGFSAICTNINAQDYDFTEVPETFTVRLSKSLFKNVKVENSPVKYYDYNF